MGSKQLVAILVTGASGFLGKHLVSMNPLAADDIRNIEAAFSKWVKQLQAVEEKLP